MLTWLYLLDHCTAAWFANSVASTASYYTQENLFVVSENETTGVLLHFQTQCYVEKTTKPKENLNAGKGRMAME